jgi:hypothetical protein
MVRWTAFITLSAALVACAPAAGGSSNHGQSSDAGSMDAGPMDAGPTPEQACASPQGSGDCSNCANQATCQMCFETVDADGVTQYDALTSCIVCTACYNSCNSASLGGACTAPTYVGACDTDTTGSQSDCTKCEMCAAAASCYSAVGDCQSNTECQDILQNLNTTCGSLPQ